MLIFLCRRELEAADESHKAGRPTPMSDVLVDITRRIHAGELEPDQANIALVREGLAG